MKIGDSIQEQYRIESILGQGNMETTYKALDTQTQRPVAIKVLHFSRLRKWKALELFDREAKVLQHIAHPQIPTYIDYFPLESEKDVQFILIQEYVEGKTLQQLVEKGWRGTELEILEIIRQLVDILDYLHTLNPPIVHRDINPKNIILSSDNTVHLVDFGAVQDRMRTTFLSGSTIVGTFGYMPFEQFSGQTVPASDYYAVGATLLYLLTYRHPSEFPTEGLKLHFHPYLQASPVMIQLLNGLLEPAAEERLASADAIHDLLRKIPESPSTQIHELTQPHGSSIQKFEEADARLRFVIPGKVKGSGVGFCSIWLLFVAIWTLAASTSDNLFFVLWSIPFWTAGFGFGIPAFYKAFGRTTLELTPESIQVTYSLFGRGYSRQLPTSTLKRVPLSNQKSESITFQTGAKALKFGAQLTPVEKEWLSQEVEQYLVSYAKPDTVISAKPHGSKLKKIVKEQSHICFRLPRKLKKEPFIGLGFMVFWFGFLVFMLVDVGEFVWFSLIFWIFGILSALGSIVGIIRMLSRTTLELTPEWLTLRFRFLGLGYSRRIPIDSINAVDILTPPQARSQAKSVRYIVLDAETKKPAFGLQLTPAEQEWLVQEIKEYLAKYRRGENNKA